MSRKFIQVTFALLLLAGMILGFAIKDRVLANSPQAEPNGKIEGALVDKFAAEGTADFVVSFSEKADLSAAYTMDWNARGHYVYDTLTATANRVQADAIRSLKELGISYKTFIAGNELYVYKGNLDAANAVATIKNVSNVRETRVYQLDPAIQTPSVKTVRWAGDLLANFAETTVAAPADFDWGITDTGAVDFWNTYGFKGEGIVVANIDTGVDYTHVALAQNFKCAANPSDPACWLDPSSDCPGDTPCDAWPGVYHGTHTMGTMVGSDNPALLHQVGMAPNAQWIACLGCPNGGCPDLNLFACADWIVAPGGNPENRPDVVNNSWGGGGGNSWYLDAVNSWRAAGVFPAFSAGNSYSCSSLGSPGDYQESFGSAAHRSDRVIADFSSKGPSFFGDSPYTKPNISAPGQDIMSAMPGDAWQLMSGTSMASPHTAGAVALLWSCNPSLKGQIDETFQVLQNNADTPPDGSCGAPGSGEGNYTYGYGYLDVNAAGLLTCGDVGYVEGFVNDVATGDPIANATVSASVVPTGTTTTTTTGADGFYHMGLLIGTYDVTASAFSYLPDTATGLVVIKDATLTQNFALTAAPAHVVSGVVTDLDTGWPLYAKITITGFPGDPIWTNPETGAYSISLPEGLLYTFNVDAFVSGYLTLSRDVGPLTGPTTEDFELAADPASCSAPGRHPDCYWFENFEGTDGGFTTGGTTSFAWGVPTSGPGEAHSGDHVWATNPAGQYNNNENGWVESPDIDLSGLAGQGVLFSWWQWLENESCCDHATVEASNDGGVTWTAIYGPVQGSVDLTWTRHEVILDPSYAVDNFRVRYYFTTDSSVVYDGWYIDDLCIVGVPAPVTVFTENFDATDGGYTTYGALSTWAWGIPTSGPMSAHSAPNVWATNLAGNYNTSENSYLESPEIDLSAYAGSSVYIRWWQWLQTESCCDYGGVEVSKDGGATWTAVYGPAYGDVNLTWTEKLAIADPSYAVSNFKMRFHLSTDFSVEYPGFYVDDVSIAVGEGALIPCVADPGGLVVGNVYDGNTHLALNGAAVLSDEGNGFVTVATPSDPNVDDGFFTFFGTPGVHVVTASLKDYQPDTKDVTFVDGGTVQQNFNLGAGFLAVDPTSLHETLDFGDSIVDQLTLSNLGVSPLTFDISERDRGFNPALKVAIPRFEGTLPVDNRPVSAGPAPQTDGQSPVASMVMPLAGEPAYAIDVYPGYNLVNIPDTTAPGTWNIVAGVPGSAYFAGDFINGDFSELFVIDYYTNLLQAVDTASGAITVIGPSIPSGGETWTGMTGATDGTMYASASACGAGTTLYTVDLATGAVTAVGPITNGPCIIDIAINTAGQMFGVDIVNDNLISIDPATGAGTIVGSLGVSANYAQGMDFEETTGILYWAAYTFSGELRIIDTTTGASTLVGGFPGGAEVDDLAFATGGATPNVPWLSEEPISGTIPAAPADQIVDVTFDASAVNQPGDYFADLKIKTDTPYGDSTVPVTMTVLAPATWGKLDGTVTDICTGQPIEEVTVDIAGGDPITRTFTDDMGYYWAWIEQGTFTVTYSIPSHISQSASVTVVAGQTTTHDVVLVPDRPCITVEPRIIEAWVLTDTLTYPTDGFLIGDPGAQDLTWELREKTGGYITSTVSIPRYEGAVIPDDRIQTNAQAPSRGEVKGGGLPLSLLLQGAPAFANDAYPTGDLVTFNLETPGTLTSIANLYPGGSDFLAGGDFLNGDFSTLYGLPYYANQLLAIDTTTGAMTVVGPAAPGGGETWSGMTASIDGTLYAVGTTCGTSTLYTIDPSTAAVTTIGPISNGGCMIDIAINTNGDMFGVDIVSDNLIQIDPATGAGTVVGYTNFSANYAQGMDFDDETGILYWAAYGFSGELRIIDTTTGNSTSVGAFQNGDEIDGFGIATGGVPVDVPWVTEQPVSGTVPAGGTQQVDVTFTAQNPDGTPMPLGTYFATLNVKNDDVVAGTQSVSVIMHIVKEYLAPVPAFETNSPVTVGEEMVFTNTSDPGIPPASEFVWDFGDGTSLTVDNMDPVIHTYGTFGTFTVSLTECNIVDCGTVTHNVVVLPKLILLPLINKN